jgi:hypothetical protein
MGLALTNEERFVASCESAGEADVRQKLSAGRYVERKAEWASAWLDQLDSGKSDATRAAEQSSRLLKARNPTTFLRLALCSLVFGLLLAAAVFVFLR